MRVEQFLCGPSDLVRRSLETDLVGLGGPSKATQLADECSEEARISSSVAGGLKLWSVLMARHMVVLG
jgi:hypothetical protein